MILNNIIDVTQQYDARSKSIENTHSNTRKAKINLKYNEWKIFERMK